MKTDREHNSDYCDDAYDATDWDDFGAGTNVPNSRNDRYSNAYGEYTGGYGHMNSAGGGGFGPTNLLGYEPLNFDSYPHPDFMGPGPFRHRQWFEQDNYEMGRGFGPQGPIRHKRNYDRIIKFLLRCGVPNENLRNLPKSMLELMTEEYCGLCGLNFNASPMARIHYVSKNHFKNQKKWATQHSNRELKVSAEVPFKARELYCEICDVHITSKSHADSHYAGKPHRAIVEGRKMSRNPILLQENMAWRLEQLIRREKKHLKATGVTYHAEKCSNSKIQPNLYCEICKATVTCTEQMTMHLNGKRHLSREKQHILKMMTGKSNDNDKEKNNEIGAEGNKESTSALDVDDNIGDDDERNSVGVEEQAKDNGDEDKDEDDWGNDSSSNWDDSEIY